MAIFIAWVKLFSNKYFYNARVGGLKFQLYSIWPGHAAHFMLSFGVLHLATNFNITGRAYLPFCVSWGG